ncbi:MAG: hypothetical protein CTY12_01295 [Methylotenera sp.]|nr:MAG: hypothetical protein CTY12_01295 [Methylotenera sp.]
MKKSGFMIKNGQRDTFFTSASAYDRPIWTSLTEATVYASESQAAKAVEKLMAYGSYSATIVEASSMQFEFPDDGPNKDQAPITQTDGEFEGNPEEEMVAGQLSDNPEEDLNLDDDEIEMGDEFDQANAEEMGDEEFPDEELPIEDDEQALNPDEQRLSRGERPQLFGSNGPVRESVIPSKQSSDAQPSENKKTVADEKPVDKIKFTQDTRNADDTNFAKEIEPMYNDVQIPANVMSAIKSSIDTYNKAAEFNNGRDDAQASMALTIVDALKNIQSCLELGTQEGLKQAQIKITTFMNPITTNFPPEVIDFLYKNGRQPISLKNVFYDKWDSKRAEKEL